MPDLQPSCMLLVLLVVPVAADDEDDVAVSMGDEEIMIFRCLLIFFGVCLAFVSAAMGLLQAFQYSWMAEFKANGRTVTASVHDLAPTTKYQTINATIDYPYSQYDTTSASAPWNYATTIRKHIKCAEVDLIKQKVPSNDANHNDCCIFIFEDGTFSFDEAVFQVPAKLSMKVVYLPDYPHSAQPKSQVSPTKLRLISAVPFVGTLMLLSAGCTHLGLRSSPLFAVGLSVASCIIFSLLLYRCIWDALKEDYTGSNSLDALTVGTLSTMASESRDVYDSVV